MLAAIRFHNETSSDTGEVDDEATDRMLTTKLVPAKLAAAQHVPESFLCLRGITAKPACLEIRHPSRISATYELIISKHPFNHLSRAAGEVDAPSGMAGEGKGGKENGQ